MTCHRISLNWCIETFLVRGVRVVLCLRISIENDTQPNTGTLKLTLGVSENAIPGSTVAFTYKGDEYKATVPYNHIPGQKTITTKIVVNEKQPVMNKSRNRRQRRGAKRDSMWHGLSADTDTENHPYWLGRKIRRFFFNQDCSNATTKQPCRNLKPLKPKPPHATLSTPRRPHSLT